MPGIRSQITNLISWQENAESSWEKVSGKGGEYGVKGQFMNQNVLSMKEFCWGEWREGGSVQNKVLIE